MTEEWKDVVGYDGAYQVSNIGNIRSMKRYRRRKTFNMSVNLSHDGYKQVGLYSGGKMKMEKVHLLVLNAFVGPRPAEDMVARHLDNDRSNADLLNLAWGTKEENEQDKANAGSCKGEKNAAARLKASNIPVIRQMIADGVTLAKIGEEYGVTEQTIWLIKAGKNWKHVL